jgi:hypothetical protein
MRVLRSRLPSFLASSALCAVGIGCSAPVGAAGAASASEGSEPSSAAVVLIERTAPSSEGARAEHVEIVARFLRMRSGPVDDDALRMVGANVDFPAVGECSTVNKASNGREPESGSARAVELVDMGTVAIEANGVAVSLPARRLPDILDLVSGVVYSTRVTDPETLPSDATYVLRASGPVSTGADTDFQALAVSAAAPLALGENDTLAVGGQDVKSSGGIALSTDTPVDVSWGAGNPEDLVYVDVTQSPGAPLAPAASTPRTVRCVFADVGHATLPVAALTPIAAVPDGDGPFQGILAIHRLHRESFQARGIDTGEIRFDFARVVTVAWTGATASPSSLTSPASLTSGSLLRR